MHGNRIGGVLFIGLGAFIFAASLQWNVADVMGDPGPTLMPHIVAILMASLGMLLTLAPQAEADGEVAGGERGGLVVLAIAVALAIGYAVLFTRAGFTVSTALYLFGAMLLLGHRSAKSVAIYAGFAVVSSLLLGFLFRSVLNVPLPGVLV